MFGSEGDDTLLGDSGNDILYGGKNNDIILGGNGSDILSGIRVMIPSLVVAVAILSASSGTGTDIITDFTDGEDKIDVWADGLTLDQLNITGNNGIP